MSPAFLPRLPLALTALRALLAPLVVLLAWSYPERALLGACLVLAFVSDVLDGVLARRLGVATPALRRLDSIADSVFYLAAAFAAWHLHPAAILVHLPALGVLAGLELGRYAFDAWKFGREASYHAWSAKLWGVCLFGGLFSLLALGIDGPAFALAIYAGILADLEGLTISLVLREWQSDVPTLLHAIRLRRASPRPAH